MQQIARQHSRRSNGMNICLWGLHNGRGHAELHKIKLNPPSVVTVQIMVALCHIWEQ